MKGKQTILVSLWGILLLTACHQQPSATIQGSLTEAKGKTLYLDYLGLKGAIVQDSVKLKADGLFHFQVPRPECYDFYRLRVDRELINLSVDSTETIQITAALPTMSIAYQIEGSENNVKLKELVMKQAELQHKIRTLIQQSGPEVGITNQKIEEAVKTYKDSIKIHYIFQDAGKPYAYFALFQRLNGQLIFNPMTSRDDIRCFATVATNLDLFYPEAERTKNLKNIALKGMSNTRKPKPVDYAALQDKIVETNIIDIDLKDVDGVSHKLTDLKGKVVLLDFTYYQHAKSAGRILALRDLYDKYSAQGFEIYQVSLDDDEHFWKTVVEEIPWICVRDEDGRNSSNAAIYGVKELPTYFLISRSNELIARDATVKDLEVEIKRLLQDVPK